MRRNSGELGELAGRSFMRPHRDLLILWGALLLAAGCGTSGNREVPAVRVTVTPGVANLHVAKSQQFTATVHNSANQAVTWSVTGAGCARAACGTIDATGLYIAPSMVPDPAKISITATAVADPTKSGTGTATIRAAVLVLVNPVSPNVRVGRTQQFTATVRNAIDAQVTWTVTGTGCTGSACGTVDRNGLYTAPKTQPSPATITVTATSAEDTTTSDGSVVMIVSATAASSWRADPTMLRDVQTPARDANAAQVLRAD
jgi:hypothetical protein